MSHSKLSNSTESAPAIDFMALLGRCLGNFKIVERVIATFRDTGRSDLNQLQTAIETGDLSVVVEISHRLKGAASNVSATGLTKLLIRAELSGREKDHPELSRILADLKSEWQAFMSFAQVFAPTTAGTELSSIVQTQDILEARHACASC